MPAQVCGDGSRSFSRCMGLAVVGILSVVAAWCTSSSLVHMVCPQTDFLLLLNCSKEAMHVPCIYLVNIVLCIIACGFWVFFGGARFDEARNTTMTGFADESEMIFQLFMATIGNEAFVDVSRSSLIVSFIPAMLRVFTVQIATACLWSKLFANCITIHSYRPVHVLCLRLRQAWCLDNIWPGCVFFVMGCCDSEHHQNWCGHRPPSCGNVPGLDCYSPAQLTYCSHVRYLPTVCHSRPFCGPCYMWGVGSLLRSVARYVLAACLHVPVGFMSADNPKLCLLVMISTSTCSTGI